MKLKIIVSALLVLLLVADASAGGRWNRRRWTVYNEEVRVHPAPVVRDNAYLVYDGDRVLYKKYEHKFYHPRYYQHEYIGYRRHGYHGPRHYNY